MTTKERTELINIIVDACEAGDRDRMEFVAVAIRYWIRLWTDADLKHWFAENMNQGSEYLESKGLKYD